MKHDITEACFSVVLPFMTTLQFKANCNLYHIWIVCGDNATSLHICSDSCLLAFCLRGSLHLRHFLKNTIFFFTYVVKQHLRLNKDFISQNCSTIIPLSAVTMKPCCTAKHLQPNKIKSKCACKFVWFNKFYKFIHQNQDESREWRCGVVSLNMLN